jgi:hypothetical protein
MRIVYVGKHDQPHSNDDEGAITHALTELGHDVSRLREINGVNVNKIDGDFVLFHKWTDITTISRLKLPGVFWYFDLVDYPDPSLEKRNINRRKWMESVLSLPTIKLGFCTDGDFVEASQGMRVPLVTLRQGADERMVGKGTPGKCPTCDQCWVGLSILFTGTVNGGRERREYLSALKEKYGSRFRHVEDGTYQRGLADLVANSSLVLALPPVTDGYWSNRVYNALGFGAFMLHPYSTALSTQYHGNDDIVYYRGLDDLLVKIDEWLLKPAEMRRIGDRALAKTKERHLYHHRCEELIRVVKERGIA